MPCTSEIVPWLGTGQATPMYLFEGQVPDVSKLRTFGCKVFAKVPLELRHKLDPRCHIGLYLGNERDTNGHIGCLLSNPMVSQL